MSYAIEVNTFNNSGVYINQQETGVLYLSETWRLLQREDYSFGLLENKIPRKLFVLERGINRKGEKCETKNFSICNLQQILSWTKPEQSGARNMQPVGTMEKYVQNGCTKTQGKDLICRPNQRIRRGNLNAHERLGACSLRLENNTIKGQAPLNTVMNIAAVLNEISVS